jgi:hypothetical protein
MTVDEPLPIALPEPVAVVVSATPFVRLRTTLAPRLGAPAAATYEVRAETSLSPRAHRRWLLSIDASLDEGVPLDATPDLSAVPGFLTAWGLPTGTEATVTAVVREPRVPLGDGTIERTAAHATKVTP